MWQQSINVWSQCMVTLHLITVHYLPVGDTCISLSTQYGATLSCHAAKSGEQCRLSTTIALDINARTYCSAHFTLDNRRPCILRDRSLGVEYLAVF